MNKFKNIKTEVNGQKFDSKKEARRFGELSLLERAGQIKGLVCQPRFPIIVNGTEVCTYVADFTYVEEGRGTVIEDVKSPPTRKLPLYRLKTKLLKVTRGLEVVEI